MHVQLTTVIRMNKLLKFLILTLFVLIYNDVNSQECNAFPNEIIGNFEGNSIYSCGWLDPEHTAIFYDFNSPTYGITLPQSAANNNHAIVLTPNNPSGNDCGYPIETNNAIDVFDQNMYTLKFLCSNTRLKEMIVTLAIFDYNTYPSSSPIFLQDYTINNTNSQWQLFQFNFTPPQEGKIKITFSVCYDDDGAISNNDYVGLDNVSLTYNCEENEEIIGGENPIEDDSTIVEECTDCSSFKPLVGERYVVSGWTRLMEEIGVEFKKLNVFNYENVYIGVNYYDINNTIIGTENKILPIGEIIDGWQRLDGTILIPSGTEEIKISLVNDNGESILAFFDDIRVHPINGNLKSFVYDQETQKLMAELDENNYATFYEYDKEGGLIRVKKETEKGVFTIQETRSSTFKK